ncbi:MAG TPA: methylglyoxal synthase [Eubacteriaceae bacterium]|nr:methylglyoxal synthase [Eubacteriaceae bacterium]
MLTPEKKRIALIAHDHRKKDLIDWIQQNEEVLSRHDLCGTGTTALRITENTRLTVKGYKSGPYGGDQEIGALIANNGIDLLIFFWDPLMAQPHDPDVKALLRIAVLYDVPVAMNKNAADYYVTSPMFQASYTRHEMFKML